MASTKAVANSLTSSPHCSAAMSAMGTQSSQATGAPSSLALLSDNNSTLSNTTSGVLLSYAIHNIFIKSFIPYTLDFQSQNYTKWCTLFTTMLGQLIN
jgi:hypothetical protein